MTETRPDGRSVRFQHRRGELLAGATEYILANGVNTLSLRPLAEDLGITHASLLRHFGSKDDLVEEVIQNIRRSLLARVEDDSAVTEATSFAERTRAVWRIVCEPQEQRQFLLLFELLGDIRTHAPFAEALVDDWVEPSVSQLRREGLTRADAYAIATLSLAQIRGLQLDLLLTRDRARVDRAMEIALSHLAQVASAARGG